MTGSAVETAPKARQRLILSVARLPNRSDFLRVAASKCRWAALGLVLQVAPRPADARLGLYDVRVGFTATRKIGNAVTRNRARRRLRAAVCEVIPPAACPDLDYVVIARAATADRPYDKLVSDLTIALRKCDALASDRTS